MSGTKSDVFVHPKAEVSTRARIGPGTRIWNESQVRDGAVIGRDCVLGKGVFVDVDVTIGDRCKLENRVNVFLGSIVGNGVFLGPGVLVLNDKRPRAVTPSGSLKSASDWNVSGVTIHDGAAVGGGAVLLPGITIGRWAMIGAGSVVTKDVGDHVLVLGNPARPAGYVCRCGERLATDSGNTTCAVCGTQNSIPALEASR